MVLGSRVSTIRQIIEELVIARSYFVPAQWLEVAAKLPVTLKYSL